jgi:two-component system chemotaxis sensor kinase CheA
VKPVAPVVMAAGIYAGQMLPDTGQPLLLIDCAGVAAAAGVTFDRVVAIEPVVEEVAPEGLAALLFEEVDGRRRAVALASIDRIETVVAATAREAGGRWWITGRTGIVPLLPGCPPLACDHDLSMLLLDGPDGAVGYLIRRAIDIVSVHEELLPASNEGAVVSIALIEGEPIELIEPLRLLGDAPSAPAERPVCLLQGKDSVWMEAILRPTIETAGYRVTRTLASGEFAAVTLSSEDEPDPGVVRLPRDAATGRVRFDPETLAQVLAAGVGR